MKMEQEIDPFWYNNRWMTKAKGKDRNGNQRNSVLPEFQDLHHKFRPKILRYLTRLVGEAEAEDLTQETFLKVSRSLKDFKGRSQVSTWIYRIATNTALDRLRSPSFLSPGRGNTAAKRPSVEGIEAEAREADGRVEKKPASAESSLILKEMNGCVRKFTNKLPANQRTVVVLSILEGMKNIEIAEILGITLETVKIRLHRGRSQLKKELETHCGWHRDARGSITWDGMIL
jgi:RNA polymerase sigma-70 factor (ECF subfamily)